MRLAAALTALPSAGLPLLLQGRFEGLKRSMTRWERLGQRCRWALWTVETGQDFLSGNSLPRCRPRCLVLLGQADTASVSADASPLHDMAWRLHSDSGPVCQASDVL